MRLPEERVGFAQAVTAGGASGILRGALRSLPSLAEAQLTGHWSNFRPHAEGGVILEGACELPRLLLAGGHYRNGILLSKASGERVAELAVSASP